MRIRPQFATILLAAIAWGSLSCQHSQASSEQAHNEKRLAAVNALAEESLTVAFTLFDSEVSRAFTEPVTQAVGGAKDLGADPTPEEAAFIEAGKQAFADEWSNDCKLPELSPEELTQVFLGAYMAWKAGDEATELSAENTPQIVALEDAGHYQLVLPAFPFVVGNRMIWQVDFDSQDRARGVELVDIFPVDSK